MTEHPDPIVRHELEIADCRRIIEKEQAGLLDLFDEFAGTPNTLNHDAAIELLSSVARSKAACAAAFFRLAVLSRRSLDLLLEGTDDRTE